MDLAALGDFPTSNRTSESLSFDAMDAKLGFPVATLALDASAQPDASERAFIGYSERVADGLDVVLWPEASACELFRATPADSYPGRLGGEALGYASSNGLVMLAGSNDATSAAIVGALTFDAGTGDSHLVDPEQRAVLSEPRAFASVSDYQGKVLVAGGENPIHDVSVVNGSLRDSAEIYDPEAQSFELELLKLAVPRTHHAAVNLDSGETVLIGGRADDSVASRFVEVISPSTRASKLIANLSLGRNEPVAVHLTDGRILVAGGTDADGHPVPALEWRSPDGGALPAPFDGSTELPARFERAFVALPGGAALAVGGCEERLPRSSEDCSAWCKRGCPPTPDALSNARYDAFWISADGAVSALSFSLSAAQPVLLPGGDGKPWLVSVGVDEAGQASPGRFVSYRFDPWQGTFQAAELDLGPGPFEDSPHFVATGADAFVWFASDAGGPALHGIRLGTRSTFTSDVELVTLRDSDDSRLPAHLAPDHVPGDAVKYDSSRGVLQFATADTSGATCVWVSDAKYGDFAAQIDFSSGTAPAIQLGSQRFLEPSPPDAAPPCQLPAQDLSQGGRLLVRRAGSHVSLGIGTALSDCELSSSGRLPLGVCGSAAGPSDVTRISVTRGG